MSTVRERTIINREYLKEYSPIPKNYNLDEVSNYIKISELIWVKPIIGDALYEELLEQVEDENISETNSTLLLHVYPLLGFAVVYEAMPFIWADISTVGITIGHSENSESLKLSDLDYLLKHLKSQMEVRQDELKCFLKQHSEQYPLYEAEDDCCKVKPNQFNQIYSTRKKNNTLK